MRGCLLHVALLAGALHLGSGLRLNGGTLPTRACPAGHTGLAMLAADGNEELTKLLMTLDGLKEDGFGPEALAPLVAKISALTERVALAESLDLTTEQRRIWRLCDEIDDEASAAPTVPCIRRGLRPIAC